MSIKLKDTASITAQNASSATSATKATQDSAGQQINTTYIKGLSVSGKTITFTKGDGTTGTLTTQDTNTTYSVGTASALGLTKLYTGTGTATDGTMTQSAIKTALDGKAASSHGRHVPDVCTTITDWNSATTNGWYMGNNATNAPTANAWYFGEVVAHNTNYVIQTVYQFTASTDAKAIPKYIRAKMNGTWGAWTNVTVAKAVPSNAVFTDTNTWRGIQNNLTSDATDQSLSAAQGKALKSLIDGKAASSHTHNSIVSRGNVTAESGTTRPAVSGISMSQAYNNSYPTAYGNVLNLKGGGDGQILVGWSGTSGAHAPVYVRSKRDNADANWSDWAQIYTTANKPTASDIGAATASHTHNYAGSSSAGGNANAAVKLATARTINGTNFDGSANITTANWGTARKINNISVNGSGDVKLPLDYYTCSVGDNNTNLYHHILSSGQCTGDYTDKSITVLLVNHYNSSGFGIAKITLRTNKASDGATANGEIQWLVRSGFSANQLCFNIRNTAKDTYMDVFYKSSGTYNSLTWYVLSEGGRGNHSSQWTKNNTNASGTNAYTEATMKTIRSYTSTLVSAAETGVTNYSNSAGYLSTARTINGTSFNGSANITTANWGTARNLTIGNTAKSVNGSANVSWTLSEIGAAASSHTHNYAGSSSAGGNANAAVKLATTRTINGTNFDGTANITTANWGTARTLTIGNSGKSVNGSANVSWSLSEIGAAAASHTHSYLPLSGGTLTGRLTANGKVSAPTTGGSWIGGMTLTNATIAVTTQQTTSSYHPILAVKTSGNHVANIGGLGDNFGFYGFKSGRTENSTDWSFVFNASSGDVTATGKITASKGFAGALSGNATTATTLQNARTINGTSFNGSANITTANWGTTRTLTIGNTGKSVNGSGNVSWSLSEIGAAAASHTHAYAPTSTGSSISIHADSDSSSTSEYLLLKAGHNELKIASSAGGTTVTKGQDKLTFNGNVVYHAGKKPTPADIGAATSSSVGTLSSLKTSAKGNLVAAINEVFQSADSARSSLVSAIGSPLTSTDTLASIATKLQSKKQELGTAAAKVVSGVSSSTNLNTIVSTLNGYKPYVGKAHTLYVDFNGGKTVYIQPQTTNGSTTIKQGSVWMAMIKDVGAKRDYCLCTSASYGFPSQTKDANNAVSFSIDGNGRISLYCNLYSSKTYRIMLCSINPTYSEIDETEDSSYYYVVKTLEEKDEEEEGRKDEESNC